MPLRPRKQPHIPAPIPQDAESNAKGGGGNGGRWGGCRFCEGYGEGAAHFGGGAVTEVHCAGAGVPPAGWVCGDGAGFRPSGEEEVFGEVYPGSVDGVRRDVDGSPGEIVGVFVFGGPWDQALEVAALEFVIDSLFSVGLGRQPFIVFLPEGYGSEVEEVILISARQYGEEFVILPSFEDTHVDFESKVCHLRGAFVALDGDEIAAGCEILGMRGEGPSRECSRWDPCQDGLIRAGA